MLKGIIAMSVRNIAMLMTIIAMPMRILPYIAMSVTIVATPMRILPYIAMSMTIIDSSTHASVAPQ